MAPTVALTWLRTSCVLVQAGGVTLLTDPWFGMRMRVLPVWRAAAIALENLPAIDLILASHLHADHFDVAAANMLVAHGAPVIAPPGSSKVLRRKGFAGDVIELAPWQTWHGRGVEVVATPAAHTGPPPAEVGLWFRVGDATCYFAGDQRFSTVFAQVGTRLGQVDVALLPVGGTQILGHRTTMDPGDAVRAAALLRPQHVLPIHEGGEWMSVPPLSRHPGRCRDFLARLATSGLPISGLRAAPGERVVVPCGVRASFCALPDAIAEAL